MENCYFGIEILSIFYQKNEIFKTFWINDKFVYFILKFKLVNLICLNFIGIQILGLFFKNNTKMSKLHFKDVLVKNYYFFRDYYSWNHNLPNDIKHLYYCFIYSIYNDNKLILLYQDSKKNFLIAVLMEKCL